MLLGDRLLGIDRDEVEDQRERLVLADDARDEPLVAFDRVVDVGDVLAGFVKLGIRVAVTRLLEVTGDTAK